MVNLEWCIKVSKAAESSDAMEALGFKDAELVKVLPEGIVKVWSRTDEDGHGRIVYLDAANASIAYERRRYEGQGTTYRKYIWEP
jgi:hypothetical protein